MPSNIDAKDFVANYELNDYRYSAFWVGREYEHESEVLLLNRLIAQYLPDLKERRIIDLGGAYGRLAPIYSHAKEIVLADYSTGELKDGQKRLQKVSYASKLKYVALNAYRLPFAENSIDALLSVRVMHHLKDANIFLQQLATALVPGGVAIIEFAHKNHLLSLLKNLFRGKLRSFLSQQILEVNHRADSQGVATEKGQISIMYNFSFEYFRDNAIKSGLRVEGVYPCSFLRLGFLKKRFKVATLLKFENFLQRFLSFLRVTPSLFIVLSKNGRFEPSSLSLEETLQCPTCSTQVKSAKESLKCVNGHDFPQSQKDIIDLRDPRPEEVNF